MQRLEVSGAVQNISMMLALSELLCYAAIAVVLDRKYRRNARKSRPKWTKKWLLNDRFFFLTLIS